MSNSLNLKTRGIERIFKLNNEPVIWSQGERDIAELILFQLYPRNQVIAPTQYGKSETISQAILLRITATGERFTVLAPSEKKTEIIVGDLIDHCFDDPMFTERLELDKSESLDRLRRQRSRNHLTFKGGGGVMALTLDARNSRRSLEAAMGFGGNRIILDESSLIEDNLYATVKRMLGGYKYSDQFLLEIGNPFYRNHFYRTWQGNRYNKIFIDYKQALTEGRYSQEFIDEMRDEALFDILYECLFPPEDLIDDRGYRNLITNEELDKHFISKLEIDESDPLKLGVDVGAGGDYNYYVLRNSKAAWVEGRNKSSDTMTNVTEVIRIYDKYTSTDDNNKQVHLLKPENIFIDDVGVGRGVTDRLQEKEMEVNGVSIGDSPLLESDKTKFKNLKAQATWYAGQWVKAGGSLISNEDFRQLTWLKYKINTEKTLQIEPKEELKKRTRKSPDCADAFILTFVPSKPETDIKFL